MLNLQYLFLVMELIHEEFNVFIIQRDNQFKKKTGVDKI